MGSYLTGFSLGGVGLICLLILSRIICGTAKNGMFLALLVFGVKLSALFMILGAEVVFEGLNPKFIAFGALWAYLSSLGLFLICILLNTSRSDNK